MRKDGKFVTQRPYRLAHQILCITAFNFHRRSLIGYVELALHPLCPDLRRLKVNSKQCRIYRVSINDIWEAAFLYNDPTLEICQGDDKKRNLDYYESSHQAAMNAVDSDYGNGEVTIRMPPEAFPIIAELRPIRVCIEFSLEQPKSGIQFVVPSMEGSLVERGAHLFTYGHENSSRLWFPCVDTYSEPCTWKLEFTVDIDMTAVSCGDLIEVIYTPDKRQKTFHYFMSIPTAAPNIALALGPFEILVDPYMHEVTHFCLPHLMPILKHTTGFLHEVFEFYEEVMSSRYPYSCYKQVFVDESYDEVMSYATISILSTNLLHSARIIDQTITSRRLMASAVAQQFFGCYISMQSWYDAWLSKGIAAYLTSLYMKKALGNNEYRHHVAATLKEVYEYESRVGGIVLDPSVRESTHPFSIKHPHTISPGYHEIYKKKAFLVIRMLEIRIGPPIVILQVLNKLLALANTASQQKFMSNSWSNMLLSTDSFLKIISTVIGKDIQPFLDQWVTQSGFAQFHGNFVFNRKRNVVELEIKQDATAKGSLKYVGPLTVTIQELDGSFNHTFKIEENKTKFEITCHSKCRRHKKKKIPLVTGEEVDMDLGAMDADSPVLWLRVDSEMHLLRHVTWEQPDYMWQYQLKYERDVVAQSQAIVALQSLPTPATRKTLTDILENEHCFYHVRLEACVCLTKVANAMESQWAGPPAMMTIFRKMFGSHSCPSIIRQNNFNNFQHYHLLKTIPVAMAQLRNVHNICPPEVVRFILDLFKYNDNSRNKYSDNYYRAVLVDALAATVTPAVTTVTLAGQNLNSEMSSDTKLILEEITRCLNLEKLLPSYRYVVSISCLKAIRILQKFGHLPSNSDIFKSYAQYGVFRDIRVSALEVLVDFIKADVNAMELNWLLDLVDTDPDQYIRYRALALLIANPPFTRTTTDSPLNTEHLVHRLWKMMNTGFSNDSRLRCAIADLYFILYGRVRPSALAIPQNVMVLNLKEKKTLLNPTVIPEVLGDMFEEEPVEVIVPKSEPEDLEMGDMVERPSESEDINPLKRKVESPLPFPAVQVVSATEPNIIAEHAADDSNPAFKFRIKVKSEDEGVSTPTRADGLGLPPVESVSMSRLSEDSDEDSSPTGESSSFTLPKTPAVRTDTLTSFSGVLTTTMASNSVVVEQSFTTPTTAEADGSNSKHKNKKKKKKNKHKHKHKHKHEKQEKDRSKSDKSERMRDHRDSSSQFSPGTTASPVELSQESTPSSPEFEII
ncbi:hypothetical protein CHS0354_019451 [Potamilus streckersoni]|uniref:Transcription initiation factor TFIID subunit 2 n=1 Tax=Potamilus streckersoni TaxID=2493646 RepID=A0AAE0SHQ5_9BIVA|nr:hypothetical protein CHS0354_019451 [Potamilus streckersoni]